MDDRYTLQVGERWVNPLRDEASLKRSGKNGIAVWSFGKGLLNGFKNC